MNYEWNNIKFKFLKKIYILLKNNFCLKKINFNWNLQPKRYEIINEIVKLKNYKSYLEIGCRDNSTFSRVSIFNKVGVDPISGGTHKMTSDAFFKQNKALFDIIFIDGLHTYEQVTKDISNSIKFLNKNGMVLLHDCLPQTLWEQANPQVQYKWTGDVWKAIVEYRTKENFETFVIDADHGIGVIIPRKNTNVLNLNVKNFKSLTYKFYVNCFKKSLNLIKYEEFRNKI